MPTDLLENVDIRDRTPIEELPTVVEAIRDAEATLGNRGRGLVRYSGTQPLCRVMVEGPTEVLTREIAERLADVVKETIG